MSDNIYKGNFICGSYQAKRLGLKENHWYTWDHKYVRPATETERRAGEGAQ